MLLPYLQHYTVYTIRLDTAFSLMVFSSVLKNSKQLIFPLEFEISSNFLSVYYSESCINFQHFFRKAIAITV